MCARSLSGGVVSQRRSGRGVRDRGARDRGARPGAKENARGALTKALDYGRYSRTVCCFTSASVHQTGLNVPFANIAA